MNWNIPGSTSVGHLTSSLTPNSLSEPEGVSLLLTGRVDATSPHRNHQISNPAAQLAVSAEELTFQFSEVVEAKETALEERLTQQAAALEKRNRSLSVTQIQAIMRLLEGRDGYEILRTQARAFVSQFQINPDAALEQLSLQAMSSQKRYALINMALDIVQSHKFDGLTQTDAVEKLRIIASDTHVPFNHGGSIAGVVHVDSKELSPSREAFYGIVGMQPTIRTLWDVANEHAKGGDLTAALAKLQHAWGKKIPPAELEKMGAMIVVHRLTQMVRSLLSDTEDLLRRIGAVEFSQPAQVNRYTRTFVDMTQSTMPGSLIDKLIDAFKSMRRRCRRCSVAGTLLCKKCSQDSIKCICVKTESPCSCRDIRSYFLSLLHWQARRWPHEIWINSDAKKATLDYLVKKQGGPSGIAAKSLTIRHDI